MAESTTGVTERGVVTKCVNGFVQVRIGRNSACASCGKCGMTENQKYVDFWAENTQSVGVGDVVEIFIPDRNAASLAMVAYGIPILPSLGMLFCGIALDLPVWASMLMFFGGFAVGFGIVVLIDKLRKHKWMQSPKILSVILRASTEENTATPAADAKDDGVANEQAEENKTQNE